MINFKTVGAPMSPPPDEEEINTKRSVHYFCPVCKEILFLNMHFPVRCGCNKKWVLPPPVCLDDKTRTPIREIDGEVK